MNQFTGSPVRVHRQVCTGSRRIGRPVNHNLFVKITTEEIMTVVSSLIQAGKRWDSMQGWPYKSLHPWQVRTVRFEDCSRALVNDPPLPVGLSPFDRAMNYPNIDEEVEVHIVRLVRGICLRRIDTVGSTRCYTTQKIGGTSGEFEP